MAIGAMAGVDDERRRGESVGHVGAGAAAGQRVGVRLLQTSMARGLFVGLGFAVRVCGARLWFRLSHGSGSGPGYDLVSGLGLWVSALGLWVSVLGLWTSIVPSLCFL